jgi:hypothetical protein
MMKGKTETEILEAIEVFLSQEKTKAHGRAITARAAADCGLNIEVIPFKDPLWADILQLHIRASEYVNGPAAKIVETSDYDYVTAAPRRRQ